MKISARFSLDADDNDTGSIVDIDSKATTTSDARLESRTQILPTNLDKMVTQFNLLILRWGCGLCRSTYNVGGPPANETTVESQLEMKLCLMVCRMGFGKRLYFPVQEDGAKLVS